MHPTLVFAEQTWSPAAMAELADRISGGLRALGVGEGDTAAVMLRNGPAYVATTIACRRAGVYLVSINWHFKAAEAGFLLADSGARVLLVHEDLQAQIAGGLAPGRRQSGDGRRQRTVGRGCHLEPMHARGARGQLRAVEGVDRRAQRRCQLVAGHFQRLAAQ